LDIGGAPAGELLCEEMGSSQYVGRRSGEQRAETLLNRGFTFA
jgi:hypothetical protein